jgi:hypothetical protein
VTTGFGAPLPLEDIAIGARLLRSVPRFLRQRIGPDRARVIVTRRFEQRESSFLTLARRAIYGDPGSPYRQLLNWAGCEYGDLERLVHAEGVEGALRILYRRGVYLSVDEFKGRRAVRRGSGRLAVDPAGLRNPSAVVHVPNYTSGSRGRATPTPLDLAHMRERAVDICLFDARGARRWRHAIWAVPGGSAISRLLEFNRAGAPIVRWFSQVDPHAPGLHARYRWIGRVLWLAGRLAGVPLPLPAHVPLDAPLPVARWMSDVLCAEDTPHVFTSPSCAVRVCRVAFEAGVDLRGAQFTLTGEPFTAARLAAVRQVGADAVPIYASVEAGRMAFGCLAPEVPDDMHLLRDEFALIQPGADGVVPGLPPSALLVTALGLTAPLILLNVSQGDQAELVERACGCPMELPGRSWHLGTVRAYEKLTAAGMTFLDSDVIRVLEEVLPSRFGGGPTDYQLVEGEAEDGRPELRLLVHPAVGPLDPSAVTDVFLTAIGGGTEGERLMELQWRQAGLPRVERRAPFVTTTSKIHHLHAERWRRDPRARE